MLGTVKRAYDNNTFNSNFICPIDLNTIELYIQILKPAYLLSISFQNSNSSIADTIPGRVYCILYILNKKNYLNIKKLNGYCV